MTTDDDFDRQIQAYLESGPAELADRVLWAARAQLKTTRRRRTGFAWLAPWRNPNMTRNSRLLLVGGGALDRGDRRRPRRVDVRATEPRAGRLGGANGTWNLGDALLTELLGGAGPELVHRCSEGARVVRNRGDDRGTNPTHGHAAAQRQGARRRRQDRPKHGQINDLGRAVRPGQRYLERDREHAEVPATATPRPSFRMARCWWPAAAAAQRAGHSRAVRPEQRDLDCHRGFPARGRHRSYRHAAPQWQGARCGRPTATQLAPSCTTRPAGPGRPPGDRRSGSTNRTYGDVAARWQGARGRRPAERPRNRLAHGRAV